MPAAVKIQRRRFNTELPPDYLPFICEVALSVVATSVIPKGKRLQKM